MFENFSFGMAYVNIIIIFIGLALYIAMGILITQRYHEKGYKASWRSVCIFLASPLSSIYVNGLIDKSEEEKKNELIENIKMMNSYLETISKKLTSDSQSDTSYES